MKNCLLFAGLWCLLLTNGLLAQTPEPKPVAKPAAKAAAPRQVIEEAAAKLEPTRTVIYKKVGERELRLDIFEPAGHKPTDRRGCLIGIHGGGWTSGEPRRFYTFADHFAKQGMLCVSLQYRLLDKAKGVTPFECVKDGRSAVRYLKAHAAELGIDPAKIAVAGGSAGGHVAAGTALFDGVDEATDDLAISSTPAALVLYYPVIDTGPQGYGMTKCGSKWKEISPVDHVLAGVPPTILFHGTGDTVTPFAGAKRFDEAMRAAGNRCEFHENDGGRHGYFLYDQTLYETTLRQTREFFKSLKLLD